MIVQISREQQKKLQFDLNDEKSSFA